MNTAVSTAVGTGSIPAFREQFAAFSKNGGGEGPAWLPALRRRAFDVFTSLGYPTTRDEDYHYTSVAPIAETAFRHLSADPGTLTAPLAPSYVIDEDWNRLVFVNGVFAPSLSRFEQLPDEVEVSTLSSALATDASFVESQLGKLALIDRNAFAALNTAFVKDGVVIRLPADCVVERPIHVLWLADEAASGASLFPRLLLDAGTHARVAVIETFAGIGGSGYFTNAVTELRVGAGARVEHYRVQREAADAFHVSTAQAYQSRDSILHSFSFATG
ncbi:MAG TPA: SufD family Fe-S cluster assembly protein, partial [Gemmatimonadaceae bacterium]|nr:SufD family Fe-S cluster assembly protein [Gemmatimonadaceae bacterium]